MGKRRKFEAVSKGLVALYDETDKVSEEMMGMPTPTPTEPPTWNEPKLLSPPQKATALFADASVCRALGVRRRALDKARRAETQTADWGFAKDEVGMSEAWCNAHGLDTASLERATGASGATFRSVRPVPNPAIVMARRLSDGTLFPVWVADASRFRPGMLFEAREEKGRWTLSDHGAWRLW